VSRLEAELEEARPFLDLAREIGEAVRRAAADGAAGPETLVEAIDAIPRRERDRLALAVFDRLPADAQWSILERVYGDEAIRDLLEAEHERCRARALRSAATRQLVNRARAESRFDTREAPAGATVTLGLFREPDVRVATGRGRRSTACARRVVLRAIDPGGRFMVIEDVFNPDGGYFVTAQYDEDTWRINDRLPAHAVTRVGSIVEAGAGPSFEPVLYLGGRVDLERDGRTIVGRLHLGYMMIGEEDVFSEEEGMP
jgi:hypothetical protein